MTQVKPGDTVLLHYTGTFKDGTIFDTSAGRAPIEFSVGSGQIIAGLEAAIPGMTVGERKTVEVLAAEAYGPRDTSALHRFPRANIPPHISLEIGRVLQVQNPEGHNLQLTVVEVTEAEVVLDANHPLAGKDLVFAIELVEIK